MSWFCYHKRRGLQIRSVERDQRGVENALVVATVAALTEGAVFLVLSAFSLLGRWCSHETDIGVWCGACMRGIVVAACCAARCNGGCTGVAARVARFVKRLQVGETRRARTHAGCFGRPLRPAPLKVHAFDMRWRPALCRLGAGMASRQRSRSRSPLATCPPPPCSAATCRLHTSGRRCARCRPLSRARHVCTMTLAAVVADCS